MAKILAGSRDKIDLTSLAAQSSVPLFLRGQENSSHHAVGVRDNGKRIHTHKTSGTVGVELAQPALSNRFGLTRKFGVSAGS